MRIWSETNVHRANYRDVGLQTRSRVIGRWIPKTAPHGNWQTHLHFRCCSLRGYGGVVLGSQLLNGWIGLHRSSSGHPIDIRSMSTLFVTSEAQLSFIPQVVIDGRAAGAELLSADFTGSQAGSANFLGAVGARRGSSCLGRSTKRARDSIHLHRICFHQDLKRIREGFHVIFSMAVAGLLLLLGSLGPFLITVTALEDVCQSRSDNPSERFGGGVAVLLPAGVPASFLCCNVMMWRGREPAIISSVPARCSIMHGESRVAVVNRSCRED